MKPLRVLPPLGLLAVVLGAILAVSLGQETALRNDLPRFRPPDADNAPSNAVSELFVVARHLNLDPVFTDRPLLIEGRRTPVPQETVVAAPADPEQVPEPPAATSIPELGPTPPPTPPDLELAGIVINTSRKAALMRILPERTETWLREGDRIGEWMLAEISQQGVRLEADGAEMTLQLFPQELP